MSTDVLEQLVDLIAERVAAKLRDAGPAHYSDQELPPHTSARAFRRAVKSGAVASSRIGRRTVVARAAWDAYVASNVLQPPAAPITDEEIIARSIAAGRGRR